MRRKILFAILLVAPFLYATVGMNACAQDPALFQGLMNSTTGTDAADADSAEDELPESLRTPRAMIKRFLAETVEGTADFAPASECLDFSETEDLTPGRRSELTYRLRYAIKRLGVLDPQDFSEAPDGETAQFTPSLPEHRPLAIQRDASGAWRFAPSTVQRIDSLFKALEGKPPIEGTWLEEHIPASWHKVWMGLPAYSWGALAIVIFLGFLIDLIVRQILFMLTLKWREYFQHDEEAQTLERKAWRPVGLFAMAMTWYFGTVIIGLPPAVLEVLLFLLRLFGVCMAVWTAFLLTDLLAKFLHARAARTHSKFDDLLVPLVTRTLKILAVCVGVVTFAQAAGWPITGLLTGMGIGSLAFAFAAKDTVANLFGSVTVLADRPFEIGDWIVTEGAEGSVEAVGMRSTRIRTFYNSVIIMPNCKLTTAVIDNMGKRRYRRFKTTLGVQYDTPPDRIEAFCEGVRELICRHPYTRKDYYHVYLNNFSASSLDILLYCFFECENWSMELRERQRLMIDIMRLATSLGVQFAFPTQTVHLYQEDTPGRAQTLRRPLNEGRQQAGRIAGPLLGPGQRPGDVTFGSGWTPDDDEASDLGDGDE